MFWREDYEAMRLVPGHGECGLRQFLFSCAIVTGLDAIGYKGRYCYESRADALAALEAWRDRGDPPGPWIKYKGADGERLGPGATE
jgi:hypothetical protein